MKIIRTNNNKKLATDYNTSPSIQTPKDQYGPGKTLFDDEDNSKHNIKKRWKKKYNELKNKRDKVLVYQIGDVVPT